MSDFYGIRPGAIPGFADAGGGRFMSVEGLPERTVRNMALFMHSLREMDQDDPLAFEMCVRHVASVIEGHLKAKAKEDPRDAAAP